MTRTKDWQALWFRGASTGRALSVAFLLIAAVAWLDHISGVRLRLFPLYFVPVAIIASGRSRRATALGALAGTIGWAIPNFGVDSWPVYSINIASQATAFFVIADLIHGLRRRAEYERARARIDPLTHLLNVRAFQAAAEVELERQRTLRSRLTLAYIDLDDFKGINLQLGHVGADRLLSRIGQELRSHVRATDIVARVGGDEFAILLPNADVDIAQVVLDRIQASLRTLEGAEVFLSAGAVTFTEPAESVESMLHRADMLMYEVKARGKRSIAVQRAEALHLGL